MESTTPTAFGEAGGLADWRLLGGDAYAWFAASSHSGGAELAARIAAWSDHATMPDLDLRSGGVRVRLDTTESMDRIDAAPALARRISEAAIDHGLVADPTAVQTLQMILDAADPAPVRSFWQTALGYRAVGDDGIGDPLRRDPPMVIQHQGRPRPLRDRLHVDIVRTPEAVEAVQSVTDCEPHGPYGVRLADTDGNEIDMVPGNDMPEDRDAADWQVLFAVMTFYPTPSPVQAGRFAATVAALADDAGISLVIDLRSDGVVIDSGKDQWEDGDDPVGDRFAMLAEQVQSAAHGLGLSADPRGLRFVQLGIDAVDVLVTRAFWANLLGYRYDPRSWVTDIYDPRRLNPVIFFQQMDIAEEDRRQHHNRLRVNLLVPQDQVQDQSDAATAVGGQIIERSGNRCILADPDGNEIVVAAGSLC